MSAVTRPTWATETREPQKPGDFGMHWTTITVGAAVIRVEQIYDFDGGKYTPEPVLADLSDTKDIYGVGSTLCDAQWCRDLAAALLHRP